MSSRTRRRLLFEVLGVVSGLGIVAAAVLLVGASFREGVPAVDGDAGAATSTPVTVPAVPYGPCDDAPADDGDCVSSIPVEESRSTEGAIARLLAGTSRVEDVQFLLLSDADWEVLFDGFLDYAYRVPGVVLDSSAALVPGAVFAFQEEWRGEGFVLSQQVLVFESPEGAERSLADWVEASVEAGLPEMDLEVIGFGDGELGPGAFTTSFVDPSATGFFADRRCGVRSGVTAGEVLVLVTFYEGSGCGSARLAPAPMVAEGLRNRILSLPR